MQLSFIHIGIAFTSLAIMNAIPVTPSDNYRLQARHEGQPSLQLLVVARTDDTTQDVQGIPSNIQGHPSGFPLQEEKKHPLDSSESINQMNQRLHELLPQLDHSNFDEVWYGKSVEVITLGLNLVSQLEKRSTNDLDLNTKILLTNFLIYLESAIDRAPTTLNEDRGNFQRLVEFSRLYGIWNYLKAKRLLFIKFTEARANAPLTFEEMESQLAEAYKNKFKTRNDLELHIAKVRNVQSRLENTMSMTWEFRTLEYAHLIAQWFQQPAVIGDQEKIAKLAFEYNTSITLFLKRLSERPLPVESQKKSTIGGGGTRRHEGGEKLTRYLTNVGHKLLQYEHQWQKSEGSSTPSRTPSPASDDTILAYRPNNAAGGQADQE